MKFRKRPVVIEAIQLTEKNLDEIFGFIERQPFSGRGFEVVYAGGKPTINIFTPEGMMTASYGDWIIRGVNGEYYPCKPDIFEKTYEPLEDAV